MDQSKKKKAFVKKLDQHLISLNVERLWKEPGHKESKDWLAEVAVIFKNLDEGDYQAFENHRQHLYPSILRTARKHAAEQIDGYMRRKVAEYKVYDFTPSRFSTTEYVKQSMIEDFKGKKDKFNYKKLVQLLNELNDNHAKGNHYSSAMIIRAVLDHIPPLLGFITFEQVAKTYPWGKTDSAHMNTLLDFRNNADDALHRIISDDEDLLEMDLPPQNRLSRLLQECFKKGSDKEFISAKEKEQESKRKNKPAPKIDISVVESGSQSWQNYSASNYMTYSYKFVLDINNYKSVKPDYLSVHLEAKTSDGVGIWKGEHYVFDVPDMPADTPYRIEAEVHDKVTVNVSDEGFHRGGQDQRFRPSIDESTMVLHIKTESGETFELPITILH